MPIVCVFWDADSVVWVADSVGAFDSLSSCHDAKTQRHLQHISCHAPAVRWGYGYARLQSERE